MAQGYTILRALGACHGGLHTAKVQLERVVEQRRRRFVGAEKPLFFAVCFDQSDVFRLTARESQVDQCLRINGEEAHGRAIFGRHVGDGRAVGDAQTGEPGAIEFDEFSDDAFLAQHFGNRQYQVRGGGTLAQTAVQTETDDFRNEHRRRLAEHSGFRFNTTDAPAENAERIHHRRVRVRAHQGIGIGFPAVAVRHGANDARQIFEIHLMADTRVRRNNFEILESGLSPAQKSVALHVALKFQLGIQGEGVDVAEIVHLDGVVDD